MVFCNFEMQICHVVKQLRRLRSKATGNKACTVPAIGSAWALVMCSWRLFLFAHFTRKLSWLTSYKWWLLKYHGFAWSWGQSPFMGASRGGRVTSRRAAFWSETFSCFVQTQHVELKPCLVGVHMVFHLWHVQYDKEKWWCLYSLCAMVGANLTCSTETVFDLMVCPWRFTFEIYNFLIVIMRFTQCAQCFVQIPHVQVKPCLVVCTWCFAQTGLTLRGWVNFTLNACAHGVGWLNAGWVDLTSAPSISLA